VQQRQDKSLHLGLQLGLDINKRTYIKKQAKAAVVAALVQANPNAISHSCTGHCNSYNHSLHPSPSLSSSHFSLANRLLVRLMTAVTLTLLFLLATTSLQAQTSGGAKGKSQQVTDTLIPGFGLQQLIREEANGSGSGAATGDTIIENQSLSLPVVIVNSVNSGQLLRRIKNDTSFYKAFKTLHVVSYRSDNHIEVYNKKGKVKASYKSKSQQERVGGCRTTKILQQQTTGDFFDHKGHYNYTIGDMFAGLFFADGKVCGETNIVKGNMNFATSGLSGIDKKKQQLKMLFFNPGRKIPGIPFIGDKLDLYDQDALKKYNYRLDTVTYADHHGYEFTITPKPGAHGIVIDYMRTIFDAETLNVLYRSYSLSYKAGVYDFDVKMQVRLDIRNGQLVPIQLYYKGNWSVVLKGRERASFSAKLSDFE